MPMRYAKPNHILHIVAHFQYAKWDKARINQLQFALKNAKLDKDKMNGVIQDLIKDGVLVPDNKNNDLYRIVREDEIKTYNQDLYCFECFLPGELVKCRNCTRAFHSTCSRRNAERPNYIIPPSNEIAEYKDEDNTNVPISSINAELQDIEAESSEHSLVSNFEVTDGPKLKRCRVVVQRLALISPNNADPNESYNESDDKQTFELPDVVCLGETRPPTRQRNTTDNSMKLDLDAQSLNEEEEAIIEKEYCTCCRLLKDGQILQPPNLEAAEICHLLEKSFKRHHSWIKHDIFKQFDNMKLSKKTISLIIKILFENRPMITLEKIKEKIKYNQYQLLNALLVDVLEFQFVLGVLFGSNSLDFDSSKYLVRDITYDIQEIRRCPDCFRHSSDRITPYWFALPCVQRHELVFAKCKGHSYWPAKVVRVLKKADKYDVRFFGGNHERAVVDKNFVRPIDSMDFPKPKSSQFKKAMNELQCYQALDKSYSYDKFSFILINKHEVDAIIKTIMEAIDGNFKMDDRTKIKKRRKTMPSGDIGNLSNFAQFLFEDNSSSNLELQSLNSTPTPRKRANTNKRRSHGEINTNSPTLPLLTTKNASYLVLEQKYENLQRQLERERELHKHELLIAKRKFYCFKCLEPSKFLCCINASYCSKICQRAHWKEGHDKHCSHREGN